MPPCACASAATTRPARPPLATPAWRPAPAYPRPHRLARARAVTLPPPGQPEFEQIYQAGPVGHDAEGRAVVLERVGRIPASLLCATYDEDSIVPHGVYVKEATRALCRDLSERAQRRLYKVVVVIDFKGVGTQHTSAEFLRLFRAYANQVHPKPKPNPSKVHPNPDSDPNPLPNPNQFNLNYPEFMSSCFVINAPYFVVGLWSVVKHWLDPRTAAKVGRLFSSHTRTLTPPTTTRELSAHSPPTPHPYLLLQFAPSPPRTLLPGRHPRRRVLLHEGLRAARHHLRRPHRDRHALVAQLGLVTRARQPGPAAAHPLCTRG